jgi:hypothetical protein
MRFYLVDLIRQQNNQKNSGVHTRLTAEGVPDKDHMEVEILTLHQALAHLEAIDLELARVVALKFFGVFHLKKWPTSWTSSKARLLRSS